MSFIKNESAAFSAEELLALDEKQLVEFMKNCIGSEGDFEFSTTDELSLLSKHQQNELFEKLRVAARNVEIERESIPVDGDALLKRLAEIAGSSSESTYPSRFDARSSISTPTPPPYETRDIELICYEELVQNGGRPVISFDVLAQALTKSNVNFEKALPWVHDSDFGDQDDQLSTALSRQADRWWDFRRWQIDNRGPAVEDDGFCAYLAALKRRHSMSRYEAMTSNPTYETTIRRMWTMKPKFCETLSRSGFSGYEKAVKERLKSHNFTQAFRLEVDPNRQETRDTWIEYLNFEYWETDRLASSLKISESRYRNAWNDFQRFCALQGPSLRSMAMFGSEINFANTSSVEERLSTTQGELENLKQKIHLFFQDTAPHRRKNEAIRRQNIRTQWIRDQLLEIEIEVETAQRNKITKDDPAQTVFSNKRKRTEDESIKSDVIFKRLRPCDVSKEGRERTRRAFSM